MLVIGLDLLYFYLQVDIAVEDMLLLLPQLLQSVLQIENQ